MVYHTAFGRSYAPTPGGLPGSVSFREDEAGARQRLIESVERARLPQLDRLLGRAGGTKFKQLLLHALSSGSAASGRYELTAGVEEFRRNIADKLVRIISDLNVVCDYLS